jgi:hypothetical protein
MRPRQAEGSTASARPPGPPRPPGSTSSAHRRCAAEGGPTRDVAAGGATRARSARLRGPVAARVRLQVSPPWATPACAPTLPRSAEVRNRAPRACPPACRCGAAALNWTEPAASRGPRRRARAAFAHPMRRSAAERSIASRPEVAAGRTRAALQWPARSQARGDAPIRRGGSGRAGPGQRVRAPSPFCRCHRPVALSRRLPRPHSLRDSPPHHTQLHGW